MVATATAAAARRRRVVGDRGAVASSAGDGSVAKTTTVTVSSVAAVGRGFDLRAGRLANGHGGETIPHALDRATDPRLCLQPGAQKNDRHAYS